MKKDLTVNTESPKTSRRTRGDEKEGNEDESDEKESKRARHDGTCSASRTVPREKISAMKLLDDVLIVSIFFHLLGSPLHALA